jgi:hypothetical protein
MLPQASKPALAVEGTTSKAPANNPLKAAPVIALIVTPYFRNPRFS